LAHGKTCKDQIPLYPFGYVIGLADRKASTATGCEFCKKAKPFSVLTEAGMGIG